MLGYWNKPEETASVLRCGWMQTGDGGYQDEDGFLFIVDRLKDMIVTGGENVYSGEVENAISQHPSVAACAVIAVPDEQWGERVHAVIVLKQEAELNKEELQAHCRRFIAGYKCPRSLEFRNELPLSAAGKVLKSQLRQEARGRN
jgi:long-chain acyl-CoA synthetase